MHGNILNKNKVKLFNTANSDLAGRISILENNVYKITYYEIISGASGTLTVPTAATINSNEFSGANCVLSEIDVNNKPTWVSPKDAGGTVVTATLNTGTGAWVKSGVTVSANVALIYSLNIRAADYFNLTNFYIIDEVVIGDFSYVLNNTTNNSVLSSLLASAMSDETGSGALVFGTSPTFTTDITTPSIILSGNISAASWTTSGVKYKDSAVTLTNTTSSGTVANSYTNVYGGDTIVSSSATTYTNYYSSFFKKSVNGSGSTFTNNWAIGTDGNVNITNSTATPFLYITASTNTMFFGGDSSTLYLGTVNNNNFEFYVNNLKVADFKRNQALFTAQAATSGSNTTYRFTTPNHTGLTASTEVFGFLYTAGSYTWNAGNITTQREFTIGSPTYNFASASTITNAYSFYVNTPIAGTNATITNNYAAGFSGRIQVLDGSNDIRIMSRSDGAAVGCIYINNTPGTGNFALAGIGNETYLNGGTKAEVRLNNTSVISVTSASITIGDAYNFVFNATTGTKIGTATSQKFAFWNATPIVQPTTAVAAATFVANTSGIANDTATFDGYTIGQVVKALRNTGLLA